MRAEAYAPGRVELLGNHTDYNRGLVLAGAIDRGMRVRGAVRDDRRIALRSSLGRFEIGCEELRPRTAPGWANYPLGVVSELCRAGIQVGGFSADIESNLPAGCGLSSSAALQVATAFFLLKLFRAEMAPMEIARLCQRAEHRFVGVQSGLLDQATSIFGRAGHVILLDARSEEIRTIPFPPELALVLAESSGKRELVAGFYNQRREETQAATQALGLGALREITPDELARRELPSLLRQRAAHIVGENDRVARAIVLLAEHDGSGFGRLMNESHESSRRNFENSTAQLDRLVEVARELPGVFGARLTGGGFGGATVTLCESAAAPQVAEELRRAGTATRVFICSLADGAEICAAT